MEIKKRESSKFTPTKVSVIGSFVQDLCFRTEVTPKIGETTIGTFETGLGGKGYNQFIACNKQGVDTKFIGCIGNDFYGKGLIDQLGIDELSYYLQISNKPSGTASIIVDKEGRNSIVVALGANDDLSISNGDLELEIRKSEILICQLESNLNTTYRALEIAKRNNITTILNPAPLNIFFDTSKLKYVDIITPNESEFDFLFRCVKPYHPGVSIWSQGYSDSELNVLCREFGVPTIIITLGDKGCFVSTTTGYYRINACKVNAIDTSGAGDVFTGSLAAGMILFRSDSNRAIEYAIHAAGLSVTRKGTSASTPSGSEVRQFILNQRGR